MRKLLRKSILGRRKACVTAFVLTTIIMLSCLPSVAPSLAENTIERKKINSSGLISYNGSLTPSLHVEGKYIKDDLGNIVYLRGTNRGHFEDGPTGGWGGFTIFLESDCEMEFDYMQSVGINVVRLYTQVDYWVYNTPGNIGGGQTMPHRDIVKTIIEKAQERGIYIIYCPWSVADAQQASFPYPTAVLPDMQAFVDYWVSVVNELGVYPNVIWEIWNEPGGGSEYTPAFQAVIDAIRATGDDHIIIIGYKMNISYLPGWGPVFSEWVFNPYPTLRFNDIKGNLLYTAHVYRRHDSFWDGSEDKYKYDDIKAMLQADTMQVKRMGDEWGLPLLIGEMGPGDWGGNEVENECFQNCLTIYNEWGISYCGWDWDHTGHWNMFADTWTDPKPNNAGRILIDAIASGKQ